MSAAADRPLTQDLILEVLAARVRAGDDTFTFSNRAKPALRALEAAGLVWFKGAVTYGNQLAGLTDAGRAACLLDGYKSSWQRKWEETEEAERDCRHLADWQAREDGEDRNAAVRRARAAYWAGRLEALLDTPGWSFTDIPEDLRRRLHAHLSGGA